MLFSDSGLQLSRGHTTNICWPTVDADKSLPCVQKACQHFVGQQAANRLLWLVGCDKHHGRMDRCILCWLHQLYFPIFHLRIIHECIETDFVHLHIHLRAVKQITAAAVSSSAESAISARVSLSINRNPPSATKSTSTEWKLIIWNPTVGLKVKVEIHQNLLNPVTIEEEQRGKKFEIK